MSNTIPTNRVTFEALLDKALARVETYFQANPGFRPIESIRRQLEFMKQFAKGGNAPTPSDQQRINVGLIAVRELQETDQELADWLMDLDYAFKRWDKLRQ